MLDDVGGCTFDDGDVIVIILVVCVCEWDDVEFLITSTVTLPYGVFAFETVVVSVIVFFVIFDSRIGVIDAVETTISPIEADFFSIILLTFDLLHILGIILIEFLSKDGLLIDVVLVIIVDRDEVFVVVVVLIVVVVVVLDIFDALIILVRVNSSKLPSPVCPCTSNNC